VLNYFKERHNSNFQLKNTKLLFIVFIISIFSLIVANKSQAQNIGTLRGVLVDSTTGEVLPFGNVLINSLKTGTTSNSQGYFLIPSIPANKYYKVSITYVGYKSKFIRVYILPNKITDIKVKLAPTNIMLQPVEKIGHRTVEKNETDLGLQRISMRSVEMLPKGVESDIFRSLQYIPGVQSTGDVSARYYVRGSPSNENLVLLNGITIYNPFHAFGIFSVVDPDMINSVEFYKGGFPPEYGGRLSSVLNIITKDGNKNRLNAMASSSFITGKALLEGPIPHGSFIITGRKSYSTEILKKFLNNQNAPINFYDASFKLNYANPNFIKGSKFIIDGFFSGDQINNNNPFIEDMKWFNNILGIRWFQVTDGPLFYEMDLSMSNFKGEVIPNLSSTRPETNNVDDISFSSKFTYIYNSKDELHVGLQIKDLDTKLFLQNSLGAVSNIGSQGTNMDIFTYYKFLRYSNFGANIGTRIELTGLSQQPGSSFTLGPYASLTYNLSSAITFKAAWGIYNQQITTLSDENDVISLFEPWIIMPNYLRPSSAIHYTGGADIYFTDFLSLDIQAYYKVLQNIPTLNNQKVLDSQPDLVEASGESYGWEFQLKYAKDPLNITASYTLSWAYKNLDGWIYYPRYDIRNSFNIMIDYNFGAGWRASAVWIFNSGLPFTQSMGYYNKFYFQDFYSNWQIYENYQPYGILADKDLARLPDYHRLDLSVSKYFEISPFKFSIDVSVINVYNRKNIFYFNRVTGERIYMLPFLPTATLKVQL
jgi:hypothetical protein